MYDSLRVSGPHRSPNQSPDQLGQRVPLWCPHGDPERPAFFLIASEKLASLLLLLEMGWTPRSPRDFPVICSAYWWGLTQKMRPRAQPVHGDQVLGCPLNSARHLGHDREEGWELAHHPPPSVCGCPAGAETWGPPGAQVTPASGEGPEPAAPELGRARLTEAIPTSLPLYCSPLELFPSSYPAVSAPPFPRCLTWSFSLTPSLSGPVCWLSVAFSAFGLKSLSDS